MSGPRALEINGEEDEESALRRAIALSLGEQLPQECHPEQSEATGGVSGADQSRAASQPSSSHDSAVKDASSVLGLDRKRMEEERLARLKRKAAEGDPTGEEPAPRRPRLDRLPSCQGPSPTPPPQREPEPIVLATGRPPREGLAFPRGIVRKTWAAGQSRKDDVKIEEVFQKDKLELAILSSFQWDEEWLMSKMDLKKTKVMLVAYAADERQKAEMRSNVPPDIIRFCFPPMGAASCMHSKLQLLKYADHLRIVIPTGNLVPYDWGETGVMENMVFLIDLPRIQNPEERATNSLTMFATELFHFLRAQGLDQKLVDSLRNYDYAETSRYGFIHTIGGSHVDDWRRTGYCGLGRTVGTLGLATDEAIEIDYACSSIGAVTDDLLSALYKACQGDEGTAEYARRTARSKRAKGEASSSAGSPGFSRERFRVYFPSQETVTRSLGGKNAAGTICLQSRWWNSPAFPREVLRDCQNVRQGVLLHSKLLLVRRSAAGGGRGAGWAYVGSANLSESAWGRLVRDRATGQPKLNCRNWECGVLVPVPRQATTEEAAGNGSSLSEVFQGCIPLPMETPGRQYGTGGASRPWFYNEA